MSPRLLSYCCTLLLLSLLTLGCTPKAAAPASPPRTTNNKPAKPATPDANLSPCPKFSDAPNPDAATDNYVIYRQLLKAQDMAGALKVWRKVYATTPAADGKRPTVYTDGVALYNDLATKNPARKAAYGDTIRMLYEQARECYPGDGYMAAIQGFDGYYTYPESATDDEVYALFKESLEIDGADKLQYFVINPMSSLVVKQHREGKIDAAEAKMVTTALNQRLAKGLADCKNPTECAPWKTIENYAPDALIYFETIRGFYDCQYYVDRYYPDFKAAPTDCDAITTAYGRMRFGECGTDRAEFAEVRAAYEANCVEATPSDGGGTGLRAAYEALKNGDSDAAIEGFEQAAQNTDDAKRRAKYLLLVAKVYYRDKRNFSQARAYARRAAEADPTDGEPYMLIGTLYASSGPLCGPGTGFDSQVVTWPAIDMWQRAKRIDSSVAAKANQLIGRYTQYMPSKSDIFQRNLKEGASYTVGCWINETTRVRTP